MPLPTLLQNLRLPVIASPMFIISTPRLVIAQVRSGIVGSFPALNARPASQVDEWVHEIASGRSILAAQALGAHFAYMGTTWIATDEANAVESYKQAIVTGHAADIVNSNLFTGVHGNYLRASIIAAGMNPDDLPQGDVSTMNFGSSDKGATKAWRDIWGSGQGIGVIETVEPVATRVDKLAAQYEAAIHELALLTR